MALQASPFTTSHHEWLHGVSAEREPLWPDSQSCRADM